MFPLLLNHNRSFLSLDVGFHNCEMGMEVGLVTFPGEVPRLLEHVGSETRCTCRCYQHNLVVFACLLVTQRETQLEMSMSPPLHTHTQSKKESLLSCCWGSQRLREPAAMVHHHPPRSSGRFPGCCPGSAHAPLLYSLPALTQPSPSAPNAPVPGEEGFLSISVTGEQ